MRIVKLAAFLVSFATSVQAGDAPAIRSLCQIAPSLKVCAEKFASLDIGLAKARLDEEFHSILEQSEDVALDFALNSFASANFSTTGDEYRALKERALVAAYAAPAEASPPDKIKIGDTGDRYFAFETISYVANVAGDKTGALKMVRERIPLVRALPDDSGWTRQYADVGMEISKQQAYFKIARDAAMYGDIRLARNIVQEAYGGKPETEFEYYLYLSTVENLAGDYEKAEKNARTALKKAPNEFCEKYASYESEKIPAHINLIESLAKQQKDFSDEAEKLRRDVTAFCTYLSGHAFNFFSVAQEIANFAPELARDFIEAGRLVDKADGENGEPSRRDVESRACKALGDDLCMREIAQFREGLLTDDKLYWADSVINSYVNAGDFDSAERLMANSTLNDEGECYRFSRFFGIDQLISDGDFARAEGWLANWVQCRAGALPNYATGFGDGGNLWSELAVSYASLARSHAKAGNIDEARRAAINSLLLAIETEKTWRLDYLPYRANDLGAAYGAAYGAFVALDQ